MACSNITDLLRSGPVRGRTATCGVWIGTLSMSLLGCNSRLTEVFDKSPAVPVAAAAETRSQIAAQGQLEPETGVLAVMAPPGDRVARIEVAEGDLVAAGDLLVELESLRAKTIELAVAEMRLTEGRERMGAEQAAASARLRVAQSELKQAETQLGQARGKLKIAEGDGGSLDVLRRAAELGDRKLDRLKSASQDPSTMRLVSDNKLEEESLKISETRAQYENARSDAADAIESAELGVQAAKLGINAAEKSILAAEASGSLASLEKQIELLRLNIETAHLTSPTAGRILTVNAMVGQATTTMPLMHLADTRKMICVAEVNVADLDLIEIGQLAEISSPGLTKTLHGSVVRIQQMISAPSMPSPFPMEPVDRHTAEVNIAIAAEDTGAAAERIRMQVDVKIFIGAERANAPEPEPSQTGAAVDPDEPR